MKKIHLSALACLVVSTLLSSNAIAQNGCDTTLSGSTSFTALQSAIDKSDPYDNDKYPYTICLAGGTRVFRAADSAERGLFVGKEHGKVSIVGDSTSPAYFEDQLKNQPTTITVAPGGHIAALKNLRISLSADWGVGVSVLDGTINQIENVSIYTFGRNAVGLETYSRNTDVTVKEVGTSRLGQLKDVYVYGLNSGTPVNITGTSIDLLDHVLFYNSTGGWSFASSRSNIHSIRSSWFIGTIFAQMTGIGRFENSFLYNFKYSPLSLVSTSIGFLNNNNVFFYGAPILEDEKQFFVEAFESDIGTFRKTRFYGNGEFPHEAVSLRQQSKVTLFDQNTIGGKEAEIEIDSSSHVGD